MKKHPRNALIAVAASVAAPALLAGTANADDTYVQVTIENLAPQNGTYLTPFFVGFHNGQFDYFNAGEAASSSLESLAEDGSPMALANDFTNSGHGSAHGVLAPGGPFAPGAMFSSTFMLDNNDASSRYFSFASMVIPSNDAFIGNDDAMGHEIFDMNGNFVGGEIIIYGTNVLDAGTEVNDEIPEHTAFFGQMAPNTGVDENGVVGSHAGFLGSFGNPNGTPSILADPMFENADFTLSGYEVARITFTEVPAPGALAVLGLAAVGRRRRR